jgi:hypothetical protein
VDMARREGLERAAVRKVKAVLEKSD